MACINGQRHLLHVQRLQLETELVELKKQMTHLACERHCHKIKFLIFYPLESIH